MQVRRSRSIVALSALATLAGCSRHFNMYNTSSGPAPQPAAINELATTTTIGSTVDAGTGAGAGDSHPYGLAIAPATIGAMTVGDILVCNFNDGAGNSGAGTTIEDLKPVAGSKPVRIAQDPSLAGCDALAINPSGNIWAAAYTANDNPIFQPTGALVTTLSTSYNWMQPWGQVFASPTPAAGSTATPPKAFFISNAGDGSIVKANITSTGLVFTPIISGFPQSISKATPTAPSVILAPAGLTYDPASDTLYVVSSATNSILSFSNASTIPANGVKITFNDGTATNGAYPNATASNFAFSGTASSQAQVVFSGAPLNLPVSSALLYNGDLVIGNTGDNNLVEIKPSTSVMVGTRNVDRGAAGAIFGIATSGTSAATQQIFFNDENTNTVVELSD